MTAFLTDDFLLQNEISRDLYHNYAKDEPIFDYHCHLPPNEIAENINFKNLTHIWLAGDHYKWRAMRTNGIDEKYCTGSASDKEKFQAWAKTVPECMRNPLYHWTHLELKRPFGISDKLLNEKTADEIWETCNEKLSLPEFSTQGLMKQFKVRAVCTTDDPTDNLEHHIKIKKDGNCEAKVYPTYRPDKAVNVDDIDSWNSWIDTLANVSEVAIDSAEALLTALKKRIDFFHEQGGRLSDHGLNTVFGGYYNEEKVEKAFTVLRKGKSMSPKKARHFQAYILVQLGEYYAEKGWTMQLHLGALRNNNKRLFEALGPDKGFDSIADYSQAEMLSAFLNRLDSNNKLPKTILYNLNPSDNEVFATMIGNFQDGSSPGKVQFGSGWWFLDQLDGMTRQINTLSNMGLLSRFIGMLTDSRSFLSYPRHEYFRRLLCNIIGTDIAQGLLPDEREHIGGMIKNICFANVKEYLEMEI
jgi:glucuronate isomerase